MQNELEVRLTRAKTPDEVLSFVEVGADFEQIFQRKAGPQGLEIRRQRYIWKAVIPSA